MILSLFFKKLSAFSIVIMLVVPGFYAAIQTRIVSAKAAPVFCVNCYTDPSSWISILNQFTNTAKNVISAAKNTITAAKTTYLALKEAVLDPIAKLLGKQLADMLVNQMFSFIAKGNNGVPAFVTNPQNYFGSVAEESTQVFLTDLQNNRPDMLPSIRNAVRNRIIEEEYVDPKRAVKSTFPGGDAAYQAYLKNPSTCPTGRAWDCYLLAHEEQNDPTQIYMNERDTLARKRESDVNLSQDEILAGDGFHTLKDCIEKDTNQNCTEYLNKTPGDTLAKQINEYLTSSLRNLEGADEIEEVFAAVAGVKNFLNSKGLANL